MDAFDLRQRLVDDYARYTRSFIKIADPLIAGTVNRALDNGVLWPEPLLQLNPTFLTGGTIEGLVQDGTLHDECARIFRTEKTPTNPIGKPLRLYTHQVEAILLAEREKSYVLTTGTGSGKSLAYIVPMVNHILKNGAGRGIQAIVVYPMNALANSQEQELRKFLEHGYGAGQSPVRFARFTGQEKEGARDRLREQPPDILLTNYMMLEFMLTRAEDRKLVQHAQGLKYLAFDELHTYRGRQGADVALLIRRARLAFNAPNLIHIGTSATMANTGTSEEQRQEVARFATTLFGVTIASQQVVLESLRRATPPLDMNDQQARRSLTDAVMQQQAPPQDPSEFAAHPLSSWIETTFGVLEEEGTERLIRRPPRPLQGPHSASSELALQTGVPPEICTDLLRQFLRKGAQLRADPTDRFPIFAFRLHQFLTRADTIWTTIEPEDERHLAIEKLGSKPGEPEIPLFPLVFCRHCGVEYYRVWIRRDPHGVRLTPRDDQQEELREDLEKGYLYVSTRSPWPQARGKVLLSRLPEFMKEADSDNEERIKSDVRDLVPTAVFVDPGGRLVSQGVGLAAGLIRKNFLFCLNPACGVAYARRQKSERSKLATLGVDNRSTATTILAVRALIELQSPDISSQARKLLSFTDDRQDASLQAGHFNDFTQVALLRSALYKAMRLRGPEGLTQADLSRGVFESLELPFEEYAADPDVRGIARTTTDDAFRKVIEYYLYRDLQRGWRVTAPNLEDCGLLRFQYLGLHEQDGLLHDTEIWSAGLTLRPPRGMPETLTTPAPLVRCAPEVHEEVICTLLDLLRRRLAVKVDVLDRDRQRELVDQTHPRLQEGTVWYLDDPRELISATVAFVGPSPGRASPNDLYISSFGLYGQYLRGTLKRFLNEGEEFRRADVDATIRFLLEALRRYGIVEQVRSGDSTGYQINPAALRWTAGDGNVRVLDRTRLRAVGEIPPEANKYFIQCYQQFADLKATLEAREHTAQVTHEERQEREERFRTADLPLLFCSPTMELGIDITQLNVVNLRNVPPTAANYAQRSGRAGRGGHPALVYTYCAGRSPHDQYYFRRPEQMVAGAAVLPRIDLCNRDLLRAHVQAIWLETAKPDLGKTLVNILDIEEEGDVIRLPLKTTLHAELRNPTHRSVAFARAEQLMQGISRDLAAATWYHPQWLKEVFDQLERSFEDACERWRQLYRAAIRQRELHHRIIADPSRPEFERTQSKRLRAQAESQLKLLTEAKGVFEGDFYSYRYFATEGFLPGYNFPRLPLSAFVPARRLRMGRDEFLSRPRFLAISEFGPQNLIYHEGARYRVYKMNLDFGAEGLEAAHELPTATLKRCVECGYAHMPDGPNLAEVCERCRAELGAHSRVADLVRLQNVSLKLAQRITCDEEERQRFGYRLVSAYRFQEISGRLDRRDADVMSGSTRLMHLNYGDATTLYRINLGWAHQRDGRTGFRLDLESGYWAPPPNDVDDPTAERRGRQALVVPYVTDTKNVLVIRPEPAASLEVMASLQSALREAIQKYFQLEPRELAVEALPSARHRKEILFYESSEGGAGVLRQIAEDPTVLPALARLALESCHFDPDTLEDRSAERCGKACYQCLLDYSNQPDHELLDRRLIRDRLRELMHSTCVPAGGTGSRAERMAALQRQCHRELDTRWLDLVDRLMLRLPSEVDFPIESCATRGHFHYREHNTVIYVDGPEHDDPAVAREDAAVNERLMSFGYIVIRFPHRESWEALFRKHPDIFGVARD